MKNLPGLRPLIYGALVLTVALGVFAGTKEATANKRSKYLVKFGWNDDGNLDPAQYSVEEIAAKLEGNTKRYKMQHYVDGSPGPEKGELDVCLPTPSPAAAAVAATPSPDVTPAASPNATVGGGSKTQTVGIASFTSADKASAFASFVNETPTPTPAGKPKKK